MKAICWQGKKDMRCEEVPEPRIEHGRDAIIQVTTCAICGSDLHLYDGFVPAMMKGDVIGHEFMGEVVEVGRDNKKLKVGDRVVVPFTICCGECAQCRRGNFSLCMTTNRNKPLGDAAFGHTTAGLFGYSQLTGGYAGGQAEFVRVPYADVAPVKVPDHLTDEQVLFLGDIFPTGWQAAVQCDLQPDDTVAIWGCGPVGQFAIRSARMLGAKRVIAIDQVPERLAMARAGGAETIDFSQENTLERLNEMTGGLGPEKVIECVGLEAVGHGITGVFDKVMTGIKMETDRGVALRECIMACQPGGVVSVPGVYGGLLAAFPFGAAMNKGLTFRMGQTHVNRWTDELLRRVEAGEIDPSFVITHTAPLGEAPEMYKTFRDKQDGCIKVVLKPGQKTPRGRGGPATVH
ncbi:zinc-dependent alcohol dehydrogenase [Caulobacter sp. 17J80-11]|uniref:zinc-dependent alcohol dehydrogenase n=1 Tax=Caulobacter sp. 17J80-11 TaxID=2763502 RepID=UPI0016537158|nr:zinc-dependent alcohol dehydrogenase [Caulobacter sp. 17J80-11]MBC6982069.1 glutathione-dependent formaldehyde dehydrogenase [Caulobacter sp. 17J80-11]